MGPLVECRDMFRENVQVRKSFLQIVERNGFAFELRKLSREVSLFED